MIISNCDTIVTSWQWAPLLSLPSQQSVLSFGEVSLPGDVSLSSYMARTKRLATFQRSRSTYKAAWQSFSMHTLLKIRQLTVTDKLSIRHTLNLLTAMHSTEARVELVQAEYANQSSPTNECLEILGWYYWLSDNYVVSGRIACTWTVSSVCWEMTAAWCLRRWWVISLPQRDWSTSTHVTQPLANTASQGRMWSSVSIWLITATTSSRSSLSISLYVSLPLPPIQFAFLSSDTIWCLSLSAGVANVSAMRHEVLLFLKEYSEWAEQCLSIAETSIWNL